MRDWWLLNKKANDTKLPVAGYLIERILDRHDRILCDKRLVNIDESIGATKHERANGFGVAATTRKSKTQPNLRNNFRAVVVLRFEVQIILSIGIKL